MDRPRQALGLFCRQSGFDFEFTSESPVGRLREAMRQPITKGAKHSLGSWWDIVFAVARTFAVFPDDEPGEITFQLLGVSVEYIDAVFKEAFRGRMGVLLLLALAFRLKVKAGLDPPFQSLLPLSLDGFLEPPRNSERGRGRALWRVYDNV